MRSGAVASHAAAPESRARIEGRGRWRGRPLRDVPLQAAGRAGFGAGEAVSEMCAEDLGTPPSPPPPEPPHTAHRRRRCASMTPWFYPGAGFARTGAGTEPASSARHSLPRAVLLRHRGPTCTAQGTYFRCRCRSQFLSPASNPGCDGGGPDGAPPGGSPPADQLTAVLYPLCGSTIFFLTLLVWS